jgi:hypothetical protein
MFQKLHSRRLKERQLGGSLQAKQRSARPKKTRACLSQAPTKQEIVPRSINRDSSYA